MEKGREFPFLANEVREVTAPEAGVRVLHGKSPKGLSIMMVLRKPFGMTKVMPNNLGTVSLRYALIHVQSCLGWQFDDAT